MSFSFKSVLAPVAAAALSAVAAAPVRFTSGPLSRSVQNESDAAIDRACAWLASRQDPAGFWGESDPGLTAVCVLALAGAGEELPAADRATVDRAVSWLLSPQSTNALPPSVATTNSAAAAALAWRDMALAVFSPATPPDLIRLKPAKAVGSAAFAMREDLLIRAQSLGESAGKALVETAMSPFPGPTGDFTADSQLAALSGDSRLFAAERLRAEAAAAAKALMARLREGFPGGDAAECWRLARCANRTLGGEISEVVGPDVATLPWRGRLANFWTTTQRIDDFGNGHWGDSVEETAFAVLLLKEL